MLIELKSMHENDTIAVVVRYVINLGRLQWDFSRETIIPFAEFSFAHHENIQIILSFDCYCYYALRLSFRIPRETASNLVHPL